MFVQGYLINKVFGQQTVTGKTLTSVCISAPVSPPGYGENPGLTQIPVLNLSSQVLSEGNEFLSQIKSRNPLD